jgi:putative tryptophan/tyrosine transport system substrate-binding protein
MRRRTFIAGLASASAWPVLVRAQQSDSIRRVGVLMGWDENDPVANGWLSRLKRGLSELGWTDGRNMRMDVRWERDVGDRMQMLAKELVQLQPDVILANSTPVAAAFQRETRTIPIVFVTISDPVGAGFVGSLPRPGGNMTGFLNQDPSMGGKWVQLLTEIAPSVKRVALMFNPETAGYPETIYQVPFEAAAQLLKVEPITSHVRNDAEIEMSIKSLGRAPGGGLVIAPHPNGAAYRALIISLAARNNVPAIYHATYWVRDGGLIGYGADRLDMYGRAASYVDRIFRGTKPADLPVELPVKFEMGVNAKTAKALGLAVPQSILLLADEVIE